MSVHLNQLLDELKDRVARMSTLVYQIVETSVESLLSADGRLAQEAIGQDARIDSEEVAIEKHCIDVLALHQPAAGDLRLVTTIIKVNSDFERIADCAVNVAQRVQPLARQESYDPPTDLRLMCNSVLSTLRDTIKAFNLQDESLARQVLKSDDVVDALYHQIVQDMLNMMESDGQKVNTDLSNIMVAKNLERIADHCTNIAEDVIYVHTGRIIRHTHAV
ncbi:MAG TPA: phosphate signaling complex protein PhoU [Tepidisphaeraceae bacterium]|nr:phosphate signaling complex protein PhoU [Tepidisphaeraceae bacterium]